ncbi:uncharacterized protein LOC127526176 [Erpetoichthys calabaricus]|uniref:uncharacterized protein LOC127526176 n=1 Tax=Erpetoichthys calabaricus TaxID=27687 RepID=UPI002234BD03|nr:uncharacterized protein LOC127526176 [Erpetoichthys calabaricus]
MQNVPIKQKHHLEIRRTPRRTQMDSLGFSVWEDSSYILSDPGVRSLLPLIFLGCCTRAQDVHVCSHTTALLKFPTNGIRNDWLVLYHNTDVIVHSTKYSEVPFCAEPQPEEHKIHLCKMGDGKTLHCVIKNVTNTDAGNYELEYGDSPYIANLKVQECATQKISTKTPDVLQKAQTSTTNSGRSNVTKPHQKELNDLIDRHESDRMQWMCPES